jgi:hypothetical protein
MNDQKEIEKLLKRANEYRYLQIKENKKSYYAVDEWLDEHDYDLQLKNAIMNGVNVAIDKVPKTMFRRLNWNQMNYENLSMMKIYVEFFLVRLFPKFFCILFCYNFLLMPIAL